MILAYCKLHLHLASNLFLNAPSLTIIPSKKFGRAQLLKFTELTRQEKCHSSALEFGADKQNHMRARSLPT